MLRGGITNVVMFKVALDPRGLFLDAAQSADSRACQGDLVSARSSFGHMLLQVSVDSLGRVNTI